MLTVAIPKRNKLQNIIVLTPKDGCKKGVNYNAPGESDFRFFLGIFVC